MANRTRVLSLSELDRIQLRRMARRSSRSAVRAQIVLLAAEGLAGSKIAEQVGCSEPTVVRWRRGFAEAGFSGLADELGRGQVRLTEDLRRLILWASLRHPPPELGLAAWSTRSMARWLRSTGTTVSHDTVARIWRRAGFAPAADGTYRFATQPVLHAARVELLGVRATPGLRIAALRGQRRSNIGPDICFIHDRQLPDQLSRLRGLTAPRHYSVAAPASWDELVETFVLATAPHFTYPRLAVRLSRLPSTGDENSMTANRRVSDAEQAECIHEMFAITARSQPDELAVVYGDTAMTYRELDARANRLAHYLRASGVTAETQVGIFMQRSPDMIVATIGVLKAAAAYVPLDPEYPAPRLAHMISEAGLRLVLTDEATRSLLPEAAVASVTFAEAVAGQPESDPLVTVDPDCLAYVIYTSGSTGQPKGVLATHRSVANVLRLIPDLLGTGPGTRLLQCASLSFDISVADILGTLTAGGTVCLVQPSALASPESFAQTLRDGDITAIVLPPSLLASLPDDDFPQLETVCAGGEACAVEIAWRFARDHRFVNAYGPTETTIAVTTYTADAGVRGLEIVPVGKPLPNTAVHILDRELRPCGEGEIGEIYVSGAGVSRGYAGRPDATAAVFVPCAYAGRPGARMYATGDLGRFLPDGNVEFRGRADQQVKIRGYRIELGEIERAAQAHPGVERAVTVLRHDGDSGPRLVAFVTRSAASEPDADGEAASQIRAFLTTRIPRFMVPSQVVILPEFPLTPNHKVDRMALETVDLSIVASKREFRPPGTDHEIRIAGIWAQLLGVDRVGRDDDFFELGGDSLLAMRVLTRISEALGVELQARDVLTARTVAALADVIAEAGHGGRAAPPITRRVSAR